jgi:hypothetical protein
MLRQVITCFAVIAVAVSRAALFETVPVMSVSLIVDHWDTTVKTTIYLHLR